MSEIQVERAHIDALLTAAVKWSRPWPDGFSYVREESAGQVGHSRVTLTAENADEVGREIWLYHFEWCGWWDDEPDEDDDLPSRAEVEGYTFEALPGEPDPVVILRAIDFYEYQTAPEEHEDWAETTTWAFLRYLRGAAISRLPGIDRVPWGISDRNVFLTFAEHGRDGDRERVQGS